MSNTLVFAMLAVGAGLSIMVAGWLVKVDDLRASMTMGQPFPGVWLPRELNIHSGITLANGSFEGGYGRTFTEYRLAEVGTKLRFPKRDERDRRDRRNNDEPRQDEAWEEPGHAASGPAAHAT